MVDRRATFDRRIPRKIIFSFFALIYKSYIARLTLVSVLLLIAGDEKLSRVPGPIDPVFVTDSVGLAGITNKNDK